MPTHLTLPPAFAFISQVERFYAALISAADSASDAEPGLGGKLLYAGELDAEGRALVVAANIAGAAILAVAADPTAQKQSIRDGVADFLVTSLDEALRILKNEIRKRETVAVCVALSPGVAEADFAVEMRERGVAPDLLRPAVPAVSAEPLQSGEDKKVLVAWSVAASPALWLPKLDVLAANCLGPEDGQARRWLRLSPRYLGRLAKGVRLLRCNEQAGAKFIERAKQAQFSAAVEILAIETPGSEPDTSTG